MPVFLPVRAAKAGGGEASDMRDVDVSPDTGGFARGEAVRVAGGTRTGARDCHRASDEEQERRLTGFKWALWKRRMKYNDASVGAFHAGR